MLHKALRVAAVASCGLFSRANDQLDERIVRLVLHDGSDLALMLLVDQPAVVETNIQQVKY